jgi:hypothetical protein
MALLRGGFFTPKQVKLKKTKQIFACKRWEHFVTKASSHFLNQHKILDFLKYIPYELFKETNFISQKGHY